MKPSKLTTRIQQANSQGRKALIPFLPAGFPNKGQFWKEFEAMDKAGADIIEIGVPFSDPVADGPVVERASLQSLEHGVSLTWILDELKERRDSISAGVVLMGYYNPFLQFGLERFARQAALAGVDGVIVPDLPYEESGPFRAQLDAHGVSLIPLVGLNTSEERMGLYAKHPAGFVYVVSVLGTTGAQETLPEELRQAIARARSIFKAPLALGFGISKRSQTEPFGDLIDAVVVGSALVSHIEQDGTAADFMKKYEQS